MFRFEAKIVPVKGMEMTGSAGPIPLPGVAGTVQVKPTGKLLAPLVMVTVVGEAAPLTFMELAGVPFVHW